MEHLNEFQKDVLEECLLKKSGGIAVHCGLGKTLISLVLALKQSGDLPILVVVSKTLVESWKFEIKKFFGDTLNYIVFHSEYIKNTLNFTLSESVKLVIT